MMTSKKTMPASVQKGRIFHTQKTASPNQPKLNKNQNQLVRKGTMKSTSTIIPKIRRLKIDTFMNLKLLKTKVESMSSEKSSVFNPVLKISLLFTSFSLSIKYQLPKMVKYRNRKILVGILLLFLGIRQKGAEKWDLDFWVNLACTNNCYWQMNLKYKINCH